VQDPTSFNNFTNSSGGQQLARNFASFTGAGGFCIPLDLTNTGISGVSDGANVTIQLIFNGGDGNLYQVSVRVACSFPTPSSHMTYMYDMTDFTQCADLTLAQNFSIPSNVSCTNSSSTSKSSASGITMTGYAGVLGFLITLFTV